MERMLVSHETLTTFCQKHHIRRLDFFGSIVRDDFKPESDVDILVEFETGHTPGLNFFLITKLSQNIVRLLF